MYYVELSHENKAFLHIKFTVSGRVAGSSIFQGYWSIQCNRLGHLPIWPIWCLSKYDKMKPKEISKHEITKALRELQV